MNNQSPWQTWWDQLIPERREELITFMAEQNPKREISLVCADPAELLARYETVPHYEDVFNLYPIFDKLMFETNILLKGPKGTGKSLAAVTWLAKHKVPIVRLACSEGTNKTDIQGSFFLKGKETPFSLGRASAAIEVANRHGMAALILEEISGLPPPTQKMLNSALDFLKAVEIDVLQRAIYLKPGCKLAVVGTMNPSTYGGTYDLNEDLKSRFPAEIELGYPPQEAELKIVQAVCGVPPKDPILNDVVKFAKETRQKGTNYALSTRDVVELVRLVKLVGLAPALQICLCKFEGDDRKTAFLRLKSIWRDPAVIGSLRKFWGSTESPESSL
jgi:MoxR-like ATPase